MHKWTLDQTQYSHEDFDRVLKINFTSLQKWIEIIPIEYTMKDMNLQHRSNQGHVNHKDKYHSFQSTFGKAQL